MDDLIKKDFGFEDEFGNWYPSRVIEHKEQPIQECDF